MANLLSKIKIDRSIEVVTTETAGMKETAFGSINAGRRVCDVLEYHYARVNFRVINSIQEMSEIVTSKPDLVVPCVKYIYDRDTSEKIWLSEYFAANRIPFTGSTRDVLVYDSDKGKAKRLVQDNGLLTAKFFFANPGAKASELPLPFPLFVKPMDAANGHGIDDNSFVTSFAAYEAKVKEIYSIYGVPALVEEYLSGREFTVAILEQLPGEKRLISPVEIVAPENSHGNRILGHREKLQNNEELKRVLEPELSAVSQLADKVFSALGVRDFGRIDIKMDAKGNPHFLEAKNKGEGPCLLVGTSCVLRAAAR